MEVARSNGTITSTCNGFVGKSATPAVAKAKIEAKEIQDLIDSQTEALN
jgi:hypothetical protein